MELRHLRYFAAVAAHGSFSRAANQLHLTQPALSRQVKSLEDEIGVALIVRGQNTISLTSAGEAFYEEAKDILARGGEGVAYWVGPDWSLYANVQRVSSRVSTLLGSLKTGRTTPMLSTI